MNVAVTVKLYMKCRRNVEPLHVFELSFLVDYILAWLLGNFNFLVSGRLAIGGSAFCFWGNLGFYAIWYRVYYRKTMINDDVMLSQALCLWRSFHRISNKRSLL